MKKLWIALTRHRRLCIAKSVLAIMLLLTPTVYAATELIQTSPDLTIPLLFNGLVPIGGIYFFAKRFLKGLDETLKELITAKNTHEKQIEHINTIHEQRGCESPGDSYVYNRRSGDKKK